MLRFGLARHQSYSRRSAFTMVELLLVIIVVGIISIVALPKFLDFRQEARVATAQNFVNHLRSALAAKKTQMALYCNRPFENWPRKEAIDLNDITEGGADGAYCTAAQIPDSEQRKFFGSGGITIPDNPFVLDSNGFPRKDLVLTTCTNLCTCTDQGAFLYNSTTGAIGEKNILNECTGRFTASVSSGSAASDVSSAESSSVGNGGGGESSSLACGSPYTVNSDTLCHDSCDATVSDTFCIESSSSSDYSVGECAYANGGDTESGPHTQGNCTYNQCGPNQYFYVGSSYKYICGDCSAFPDMWYPNGPGFIDCNGTSSSSSVYGLTANCGADSSYPGSNIISGGCSPDGGTVSINGIGAACVGGQYSSSGNYVGDFTITYGDTSTSVTCPTIDISSSSSDASVGSVLTISSAYTGIYNGADNIWVSGSCTDGASITMSGPGFGGSATCNTGTYSMNSGMGSIGFCSPGSVTVSDNYGNSAITSFTCYENSSSSSSSEIANSISIDSCEVVYDYSTGYTACTISGSCNGGYLGALAVNNYNFDTCPGGSFTYNVVDSAPCANRITSTGTYTFDHNGMAPSVSATCNFSTINGP